MRDRFEKAEQEWLPDLTALLRELQAGIQDDYRATDAPSDDVPAMAVTIAAGDDLSGWTYQTGDNSFTGGCYSYPYWGCGSIARDDDPAEIAKALLSDLFEQFSE